MNLDPIMRLFSGHEGPFVMLVLLVLALAALWGIWTALTKCRRLKFYAQAWPIIVFLLTAWWVFALMNAISVGGGLPGNGWDGFGAAVILFLSIPAFILDIIFLLRWPRNHPPHLK